MPRPHIHGSPRRFHYGSNPTDDPGNDNSRSPILMHNASTATYDYGCNTEIYGLIQIATDDAGLYPWLILRQIRECVTWALLRKYGNYCANTLLLYSDLRIELRVIKSQLYLTTLASLDLFHISQMDFPTVIDSTSPLPF